MEPEQKQVSREELAKFMTDLSHEELEQFVSIAERGIDPALVLNLNAVILALKPKKRAYVRKAKA